MGKAARRPWRAAPLAMALIAATAGAQESEHQAHHPQPTAQPGMPGPNMQGSGMTMSTMMESEGEHDGDYRRPLFPGLTDTARLSIADRHNIASEADQRIASGLSLVRAGTGQAARASTSAEMRAASEKMREGLASIESGSAAHALLESPAAPGAAATSWLRDQMAITQPEADRRWNLLGLGALHLAAMTLGGLLAVSLLVLQYLRLRRAGSLLATPLTRPDPAQIETSASALTGLLAPPGPAQERTAAAPVAAARRRWSGELRVAQIVSETPSVETFRLVNSGGGNLPFEFAPGQFVQVEILLAEGKAARRSYTIASSPTQRAYVEITVKREPQGVVSCFLHDQIKVGDTLKVSGPFGNFTFTGSDAQSIVLIAGGVGITPMMSVLRFLTDTAWPGEIFFLYGARSTEEFIFRDEIERLERRHPNLHVLATMQRSPGTIWLGPEGNLTKDLVQSAVPEIAGRRIHLCGPPAMMSAVKAMLQDLGVPDAQIHSEAFGPASLPAEHAPEAVTSAAPPSVRPEQQDRVQARPAPAPSASPVAETTVTFALSGISAPLDAGETVLEAAEASGVEIPFSCRVGECGVCVTKLLQGQVSMEVESGLAPSDKEQGYVLACQAKSCGGPLVIEA